MMSILANIVRTISDFNDLELACGNTQVSLLHTEHY